MKSNTALKQDLDLPVATPAVSTGRRIEQYVANHKTSTMGLVMKTKQPSTDAGNKA